MTEPSDSAPDAPEEAPAPADTPEPAPPAKEESSVSRQKSDKVPVPSDLPPQGEPVDLFKWLKEKFHATKYKKEVFYSTILFLLALEVYRELNHIAFPLFLYRPFRRIRQIIDCVCNSLTC